MPSNWSRSGPRFSTWALALHAFYKRHCQPNIILQLPSVRRRCATLYQLSSCWLLRLHSPNGDLSCIHLWTITNQILVNSIKSQALVVNTSCRVASPQINLGGSQIACFAKVYSLGLMFNQNLTWSDQINKFCRNVFFTLKRLWSMA
jgi:hypothetical protein